MTINKELSMDHIRILKRAFSITTTYRALWIFGILVALTAGGRISGSSNGRGGSSVPGPRTWPTLSPDAITGLIVAGLVVLVITLLLFAAAVRAAYVAGTGRVP